VPDGKGGWHVVNPALGFPAGKKKTVLIDLRGVFPAGTAVAERRLRLRTNMEVYWDRLEWAVGLPDSKFEVHKLDRPSAELLYRGFSKTAQAGDSFLSFLITIASTARVRDGATSSDTSRATETSRNCSQRPTTGSLSLTPAMRSGSSFRHSLRRRTAGYVTLC
jgi:hypothetical protein